MTLEQFRKTLNDLHINHHDKIRVLVSSNEEIESEYINGIINLKIDPVHLCISCNYDINGNIDTSFVYSFELDRILEIEKLWYE